MHLKMSFAICFNLDQSKNLLSGNELMHHYDAFMDKKKSTISLREVQWPFAMQKNSGMAKSFQLVDL